VLAPEGELARPESDREALLWPRSPRPPTGGTTAPGASSPARSPRRWGSRSRASRTRRASGPTGSPSSECGCTAPLATRLGAFCLQATSQESPAAIYFKHAGCYKEQLQCELAITIENRGRIHVQNRSG
jgi:hypothetical protein